MTAPAGSRFEYTDEDQVDIGGAAAAAAPAAPSAPAAPAAGGPAKGLGNAEKLAQKLAKRAETGNEAMPFVPPRGVNTIEDSTGAVSAYYDTVHHRWLWENGTPFDAEQQAAMEAWEKDDPSSPYIDQDEPPFAQLRTGAAPTEEPTPTVEEDS